MKSRMREFMHHAGRASTRPRVAAMVRLLALLLLLLAGLTGETLAHPLGNFTINHFTRIEVGTTRVRLHYVVDMAEIPTFQELQAMSASAEGTPSSAELNSYLGRVAAQYADGLLLNIDGLRVPLRASAKTIYTPQGAGGLLLLRVECDFEGTVPTSDESGQRRLSFEDANHPDRIGWHEIVVVPVESIAVFDSNAFGSALTDELKAYPQEMLTAPLDERTAKFSFSEGSAPSGSTALRKRDGRPVEQARDRLAELISVRHLTPLVALLGLLLAAGLGALHALSPGHGKAVVGAYLVGSRGTARHAAFLGLTVTMTHTIGVFALGLATLFASRYVVPERLFPLLAFASGAIILTLGLSLFIRRLRAVKGEHLSHEHHAHADHEAPSHSHGGKIHTHLPVGAEGSEVTWRSLLALGISGGLLPCPSALIVLLSAISLNRVGYGLMLVVAFSGGLAATLTTIGLAFVYAGRFIKRPLGESRLVKLLPVASALVIACVGAVICFEALAQSGIHVFAFFTNLFNQAVAVNASGEASKPLSSLGAFAVLGLGLIFGLKHATEVDHIVAVSTIVSEHRSILRSALVGGLWGVGHTISLVLVGVVVLVLRVSIPERVANWLEFGVALMIIALGASAFLRALRGRADIHLHEHSHDGVAHTHLHFHERETAHQGTARAHAHPVSHIGLKPLIVGAMHGLAGSAALTLLVLTQIQSTALGLLYLAVFGLGSIFGMLLVSGLVGLPFALGARRLSGVSQGMQTVAGALSIAFGLWYAYETGIASGLLATILGGT